MGWTDAIKTAGTVGGRLWGIIIERVWRAALENVRLRRELAEARAQLETRQGLEAMELRDNVYWRPRTDGTREGPFCPTCRHGDQEKAVPMLSGEGSDLWQCPTCRTRIHKPGVRPRAPTARRSSYFWDRYRDRHDYR